MKGQLYRLNNSIISILWGYQWEFGGGWAIVGLNSSGSLTEGELFCLFFTCERLGFKENLE